MMDVMLVLYANGITKVPVGALMRLLGVDNDEAATHDHEYMKLDEKFSEMFCELNINDIESAEVPPGTTIH